MESAFTYNPGSVTFNDTGAMSHYLANFVSLGQFRIHLGNLSKAFKTLRLEPIFPLNNLCLLKKINKIRKVKRKQFAVKVFCFSWVVVVAQLAERSLPTPEVRGSNLIIGKVLTERF